MGPPGRDKGECLASVGRWKFRLIPSAALYSANACTGCSYERMVPLTVLRVLNHGCRPSEDQLSRRASRFPDHGLDVVRIELQRPVI